MSAEMLRPIAKGPAAREIALLMAEVRKAEDAAAAQAFADCEALVSAGLLALAEKEDEKATEMDKAHERAVNGAKSPMLAEVALQAFINHSGRAACLREMSLAVSLGQFRTAECNERAIVAAHREAAGFNSSKAGGEARMKALSPERRRDIAAAGGKGKKAFGKLSLAQRTFLAVLRRNDPHFYHLCDIEDPRPQGASAWWRTARSLAKRGAVEKVSGVNAYKLTDAARARWAAKKGE